MNVICFEYTGRFGHFLKAEANASAPSYPIPPRTVLLGLLGAVLGLAKDTPQIVLKNAHLALGGKIPGTHWHSANLRKDPPAPLSYTIRRSAKGSSSRQRNTIISQEWLVKPCYRVWANIPEPFHTDLAQRLQDRRWHFSPCLGLSEMSAELNFIGEYSSEVLPNGKHWINTALRRDAGNLDMDLACEQELAIHMLRMPRDVSPDRQFQHEAYYVEREGRSIPVITDQAWQVAKDKVVFL